jgi:DNA-directed RNA polymerase specialized sigma24 family protein
LGVSAKVTAKIRPIKKEVYPLEYTYEQLLYQLFDLDNPRIFDEIDGWLSAFDCLPDAQRIVFNLWLQGVKDKEIAKELKLKNGTVRIRLMRAKRAMVKLLYES